MSFKMEQEVKKYMTREYSQDILEECRRAAEVHTIQVMERREKYFEID